MAREADEFNSREESYYKSHIKKNGREESYHKSHIKENACDKQTYNPDKNTVAEKLPGMTNRRMLSRSLSEDNINVKIPRKPLGTARFHVALKPLPRRKLDMSFNENTRVFAAINNTRRNSSSLQNGYSTEANTGMGTYRRKSVPNCFKTRRSLSPIPSLSASYSQSLADRKTSLLRRDKLTNILGFNRNSNVLHNDFVSESFDNEICSEKLGPELETISENIILPSVNNLPSCNNPPRCNTPLRMSPMSSTPIWCSYTLQMNRKASTIPEEADEKMREITDETIHQVPHNLDSGDYICKADNNTYVINTPNGGNLLNGDNHVHIQDDNIDDPDNGDNISASIDNIIFHNGETTGYRDESENKTKTKVDSELKEDRLPTLSHEVPFEEKIDRFLRSMEDLNMHQV